MTIERYFTENSDGTIEFTPIAKDDARLTYRHLIEHLSNYREKIKEEQNLLDITPKENEDLLKGCLNNLIKYKVELRVVENQFESVKRWFDKNNLPYPGSSKDQKQKERQKEYLDEYKALIQRKFKGGDTNESPYDPYLGLTFIEWNSLSKQKQVERLADMARSDEKFSYLVWHKRFKLEFPEGYSVEMGRYKKKFRRSNRGEQFAINGLAFYKKNR
mgnify:CR=1 FL=1